MRASCAAELIAPTSVFLSSGWPTRSVDSRRCSAAISSSSIDSWTSSREPAQHTWPWLKKMPLTMPSTAWSSGASSKMMLAALPPSSRVSFLPVPAVVRWMILPTSVDPVKAILSTPSCSTIAWPIDGPPASTLTTPGGRSASAMISASTSADSGVVSAGLRMTVLPHASAGAIFHAAISSGKFHGITCPATPIGRGSGPNPAWPSLSAQPA